MKQKKRTLVSIEESAKLLKMSQDHLLELIAGGDLRAYAYISNSRTFCEVRRKELAEAIYSRSECIEDGLAKENDSNDDWWDLERFPISRLWLSFQEVDTYRIRVSNKGLEVLDKDYCRISIGGKVNSFNTPLQRAIIRFMIENGGLEGREFKPTDIFPKISSDVRGNEGRMDKAFRDNSAFGTFIIKVSHGRYKLKIT